MRRRDIVAGIGSLGVLGSAGAIVRYGPPSVGGDGEDDAADDGDEERQWPMEVETVAARGSEDGTLTVPSEDVMVLMFFVNGCGNCQVQTGRLADARAQLADDHGDDVTFLSLTYDSEDGFPPEELREWWETHGGNGYVSYDASEPMREYSAVGYPVTIVIDPDGEEHWRETGTTDGSRIASEVEAVLAARADADDGDDDEEPDGDDTEEPGANESSDGDAVDDGRTETEADGEPEADGESEADDQAASGDEADGDSSAPATDDSD